MSDQKGGRLSDWSRRKLDAKRQEDAVEKQPEPPVSETPEPPVDDPALIAALPPLDEITADSDITAFLAKGIPAHLKNAALRKLWQASPAVRDYLDPAVDYAWDWNAPGGVPGGGGVLSEHSIAKMVKGIIGTRSEDAEDAIEEDAAPEKVEPIKVAHQPQATPVAVRRDTPTATTPRDETDAPRTADDADRLPQRRHGGAVPE